jgi:uncharacterized protein (DUF1330 family)
MTATKIKEHHMAKGYWIARVTVNDPAGYAEYRKRNAVAFAKYGAKFIVRGGGKGVFGTSREHNVVLEFPTHEAALACFDSPEYKDASQFLKKSCEVDLVIAEGYEGAQL